MCIATGCFTVSASGVEPARRSSALCPDTRPPWGAVSAAVMPFARATGMQLAVRLHGQPGLAPAG